MGKDTLNKISIDSIVTLNEEFGYEFEIKAGRMTKEIIPITDQSEQG